jgi:hypothetical protein
MSEPAPEPGAEPVAQPKQQPPSGFFETLRGAVLTSIPALSALVFVIVAVKVFRASMMESTTTVAIVSSANAVALLKGVILTLLPGFLAGLAALAIWWWGSVLPERIESTDADRRKALGSAQAIFAWAMLVVAFFTVWWPVFLILAAPLLATTVALCVLALRGTREPSNSQLLRVAAFTVPSVLVLVVTLSLLAAGVILWPTCVVLAVLFIVVALSAAFGWWPRRVPHLRTAMRVFGLVAAAIFVGILALEPSVWLPLREVTFVGRPPTLNPKKGPLDPHVAAYVLSSDADSVSLLLQNPRAVLQISTTRVSPVMPLCVPPEATHRKFTLRASQVLGIDADPHTPYRECPGLKKKGI